MNNSTKLFAATGLCALLLAQPAIRAAAKPNTETLIKTLKSVGPEGMGNAEAADAWRALVDSGPDALFPLCHTHFVGKD